VKLIVNADDFGLTAGVNRAVADAHRRGVLTSASLMVDAPAADDAARLAGVLPGLSVGLHADAEPGTSWAEALEAQIYGFAALVGRPPTHLDSHHNAHRAPDALPAFRRVAESLGIPLREHSDVRYWSRFYGAWGGESHPEQVSVESFVRMLDEALAPPCTEIACHPAYVDAELRSSYTAEREVELRTLCDPRLRAAIEERGIDLVSYAGIEAPR
jgi:predicted glycoside hydrolase/deacetylase ChbG (UPF0249 family)